MGRGLGLAAIVLVGVAIWLWGRDPGHERAVRHDPPQGVRGNARDAVPVEEPGTTEPRRDRVVGIVKLHDEPAPGAQVAVYPPPHEDAPWRVMPEPVAVARAGPDGRYALDLPPGEWLLVPTVDGTAGFATTATPPDECDLAVESAPDARLQVVDDEGNPVAGARAMLFHEGGPARAMLVADANGAIVAPLREGDWLLVRAPGFEEREFFFEGDGSSPLRIALGAGARIAGTVVDADGRPVAGAAVLAEPMSMIRWRTATGPDGRFLFDGLAGGCWLRVEKENLMPWEKSVVVGDERVRVELAREGLLAGVVVFEDGRPAEYATVVAEDAQDAVTSFTDEDGRFEAGPLRAGPVAVRAHWGEIEEVPFEKDTPTHVGTARGAVPGEVRIVLGRAPQSFARLRFVDADGAPVEDVRVGPVQAATMGDEEGRVVVSFRAPPGTRKRVTVRDPGRPRLGTDVVTHATPDGPETLVRFPRPVVVTFVVVSPDGTPLPSDGKASISVRGVHAGTRTDVGHDRVTAPVSPVGGEPHVVVMATGFPDQRHPFDVPARPGTVEIRLRHGGVLRGRAVGMTEGIVSVLVEGHERLRVWSLEPDGTFEARGLAAGAARITIGADEWMPGVLLRAEIRHGETTDLGAVRVVAPRIVRGRVVASDGTALGGAHVSPPSVESFWSSGAITRPDGTFRLRVPGSLEGDLVVSKPHYGTVEAALDAGGPIVLPPEGRVLLTVERNGVAAGLKSWNCFVQYPGRERTWDPWEGGGRGPEPARLLPGLRPGRVLIHVKSEGATKTIAVEVVAGGTLATRVQFP